MDADNELRQGVLAAASANFTAMNYTLAATKAKLTAMRNLRIKGQAEQPSLLTAVIFSFCFSEFMQS